MSEKLPRFAVPGSLQVVDNTGRSVSYSYDTALQLTAETIDDPGTGTTSTNYAYDGAPRAPIRCIALMSPLIFPIRL